MYRRGELKRDARSLCVSMWEEGCFTPREHNITDLQPGSFRNAERFPEETQKLDVSRDVCHPWGLASPAVAMKGSGKGIGRPRESIVSILTDTLPSWTTKIMVMS